MKIIKCRNLLNYSGLSNCCEQLVPRVVHTTLVCYVFFLHFYYFYHCLTMNFLKKDTNLLGDVPQEAGGVESK